MARPELDVSEEEIYDDLRRVAKKLRTRTFTRDQYREHGSYSDHLIKRLCGGFRQAFDNAIGSDQTELEVRACVEEGLSPSEAAKRLCIRVSEYREIERRLITRGFSPKHDMVRTVPDGFKVKGVSTYYNKEGKPTGQWVKSNADLDRQREMMMSAIEAMGEDLPRLAPIVPPAASNADLLNCYVITDYHLGMLSWSEETGSDYDLKIAEEQLVRWFAAAIASSPDADTAVFIQLGDYLHWDGLDAVTPTSKNLLDADTRFQKLVRVAIRVTRQVIDMLLGKHKHVHVIMAEGNHDLASSVWLREWFSVIYEHEPRITVDRSPDPYYCVEHGQTSLFVHHGHKRKPSAISDVFVAKFRDVFGRTKHSYAHMGHMHHVDIKENNLMIVEQHRTLAAPDAHASRGGWMSGRDAKVITYHRDYGEVGRLTINSDMLKTRHQV